MLQLQSSKGGGAKGSAAYGAMSQLQPSKGALLRASVKGAYHGGKGPVALGANKQMMTRPKEGGTLSSVAGKAAGNKGSGAFGSVAGSKGSGAIGSNAGSKGSGAMGKGVMSKGSAVGSKGSTMGSIAGKKGVGKGAGITPRPPQKSNHVLITNFPESWSIAGGDILAEFLKAQLDLFGGLSAPVKVAPNLTEAEAVFSKVEEAEEAIQTLNGADLRGDDEKGDDESAYQGLKLSFKSASAHGAMKSAQSVSVPGANESVSVLGANRSALMRAQAAASKSMKPPVQPKLGVSAAGALAPKKKQDEWKEPTPPTPLPEPAEEGAFPEFVGWWNVNFSGGSHEWELKYKIESNGNVKIGKKGKAQLVPAGSADDRRADGNYINTYFVAGLAQEWTWEYAWMEDEVLNVHHFSDYHDEASLSPLGSPYFVAAGHGYLKDSGDSVSSQKKAKAAPPSDDPVVNDPFTSAVNVPDLEGVWYRMFQNAQGKHEVGGKCSIFASGEVKMGTAKRKLQLVQAGSADDVKLDPNYLWDGCFLLNNAMGQDTWEYIWLEDDGKIQIHHFGSSETGESPFGSPNFWGAGIATTEKPSSWAGSGTSASGKASMKGGSVKGGESFGGSVKGGGRGSSLRDMFSGSSFPQDRGANLREMFGGSQDSWGAPLKKPRTSW